MKYRDLIQFEPVESVIELRWADDPTRAEQLVASYVISDRMADVILHQILPVLDLHPSTHSGGLFVVGNYGTGKSHLMSVISAVAEHADLGQYLTHPAVAQGLEPILGRFQVVRQEFGATKMPLRDVVLMYMEEGLARLGVEVRFPSMEEAPNTKDLLVEMMATFHERYPDQGLLVVIDELLEFLDSRNDKELVLDLAFLRELGETCSQTRLRFIAGLQEALFDSPRFQFAADSVRRVKDRFSQVRIVREDVAYVVSRRLLHKTSQQEQRIRRHLEQFTALYEDMDERLDEYVSLFPIHPAYLRMFERVTIIEKRQALREISLEMQQWLDRDVPRDAPGLISYDSYWRAIKRDVAYRATPEIREVLEKTEVLEEKIQTSVSASFRDAAYRIIHALALHRLTVGDLHAPIGLTAKELRDSLCLMLPIPERDADFLLATVESVLNEIIRAVSGQFISRNPENGQYYLDLQKDIDFDALIQQRAQSLDANAKDRYYFEMLAHALELTESTYVPGFRIWQREIPWPGHGITRDGYFFLGAPNERSTAQPERDFYIHFLAIYSQNGRAREALEKGGDDEVFFILDKWDEEFEEALTLFAGAREMSAISSTATSRHYENKADYYRRVMVQWLRENFVSVFKVSHRGQTYAISELLARYRVDLHHTSLRDQVFRLSSALLAPVFEARYPDYPRFHGISLTTETLPQAANAALRVIAGGMMTRQAQAVLEGLELVRKEEGDWIFTPEESRYARPLLQRLEALPPGQVINRSDLFHGDPRRERSVFFNLEPEWLAVILMALVRQGVITLRLRGRTIGADDLETVAKLGVGELLNFTSISRPKALPERMLRTLFQGLGIPEGLIRDPSEHELAVLTLGNLVVQELNRVAPAQARLNKGLFFWGEPVLSEDEVRRWQKRLREYQSMLDTLARVRNPGHLRTIPFTEEQVKRYLKGRRILHDLDRLQDTLEQLRPKVDYLRDASQVLPESDPWQKQYQEVRREVLERLQTPETRSRPATITRIRNALDELQTAYQQRYLTYHDRTRLNPAQAQRKQRLKHDPRLAQLRALATLYLLPDKELAQWESLMDELSPCDGCTSRDLRNQTVCPHCSYAPAADDLTGPSAEARLTQAEEDFENLYARWLRTLREELTKPSAQENVRLLPKAQQKAISAFLQTGQLPDKLPQSLVTAMQDALQGLEKVVIDGADLLLALTEPGMPCTPDDLEQRFRSFLREHTQGKPPTRVRIQIDW